MQEIMEDLTYDIMNQLQQRVLNCLRGLQSDVEVALGQQIVSEAEQSERQEKEQAKKKLKSLLVTLKEKYAKISDDISSIC
jgi:hypothetical protein